MTARGTIEALEAALASAQKQVKHAVNAFSSTQGLGEFVAAQDVLLTAERALAAAKDEPHAVPIDFPVQWDVGAPLPHLLLNDYRAFLVFFLRDIDPDWEGTNVNIRHPDDPALSNLAIVEFKGCVSSKMGAPNDEVFHGHPLNGKGLRAYTALQVKNSVWIKELDAINSVHSNYRPESWREFSHYIFGFHDSTFECVATSFVVEARMATLSDVLAEICGKLVQ